MKGPFLPVVRALRVAEGQIILLARSHPTNWLELHSRLTEKWKSGQPEEPVFQFAPPPDLSNLRRALGLLEKWSEAQGLWGEIFAARCRELQLEAEIVEHVGDPSIQDRAQRRFRVEGDDHCESLRQLAGNWVQFGPSSESAETIRSDDERDDRSLICQMRHELAARGFPFSVKLEGRLASHATVDDKFVWIRPRVHLSAQESKRIVLHEVYGHVARRVAVTSPENAGYACGTAGADADEEGRALWLEDASGLFDSTRRVEIGRRHLAADACRHGATFSDTVKLLIEVDTPTERAISMALRVWRGGGIAREIVYLGAFCRAQKVLGESTEIEDWMKRGRISFAVAARLAEGSLQPLD